ncbi:unnamed protein product [Tilletia controversa]|nr:unnamed protein product [Tilletia controversa]
MSHPPEGHEAYGSIPPTSPSLFRGPQATSAAASITVSPKLLVSQSYYQHLQQMANERRKLVAEVEMLRASTAPSLPPLGPSSSAPLMTNAGIRPGITSLSSTSGVSDAVRSPSGFRSAQILRNFRTAPANVRASMSVAGTLKSRVPSTSTMPSNPVPKDPECIKLAYDCKHFQQKQAYIVCNRDTPPDLPHGSSLPPWTVLFQKSKWTSGSEPAATTTKRTGCDTCGAVMPSHRLAKHTCAIQVKVKKEVAEGSKSGCRVKEEGAQTFTNTRDDAISILSTDDSALDSDAEHGGEDNHRVLSRKLERLGTKRKAKVNDDQAKHALHGKRAKSLEEGTGGTRKGNGKARAVSPEDETNNENGIETEAEIEIDTNNEDDEIDRKEFCYVCNSDTMPEMFTDDEDDLGEGVNWVRCDVPSCGQWVSWTLTQ